MGGFSDERDTEMTVGEYIRLKTKIAVLREIALTYQPRLTIGEIIRRMEDDIKKAEE